MQHLEYEMKSLSKFTIALSCLLLRSLLRHIVLLVPSVSALPASQIWSQQLTVHVISLFFLSLLRAGVQPTLDPSAETISSSNALAQGERSGIDWCVRVCA